MREEPLPARYAVAFALHAGQSYRFNFAGAPGGTGIYLGHVYVGESDPWLAFENDNGEISFYNPALLCSLRPESYPQEMGG